MVAVLVLLFIKQTPNLSPLSLYRVSHGHGLWPAALRLLCALFRKI